jgi:hypothetical protein
MVHLWAKLEGHSLRDRGRPIDAYALKTVFRDDAFPQTSKVFMKSLHSASAAQK